MFVMPARSYTVLSLPSMRSNEYADGCPHYEMRHTNAGRREECPWPLPICLPDLEAGHAMPLRYHNQVSLRPLCEET